MKHEEQGDLFANHAYLPQIAKGDIEVLGVKDRQYGASWKKRGGTGAFMMLARMWDRIEHLSEQQGFDIFAAVRLDVPGREGTLNAIQDLRRYLLLVESECLSQGWVNGPHPSPETFDTDQGQDPVPGMAACGEHVKFGHMPWCLKCKGAERGTFPVTTNVGNDDPIDPSHGYGTRS